MDPVSTQILRTLDKHDKLGTAGVVEQLQKPKEEFGANLDAVRAHLIGMFLDSKGETNEGTLENLRQWYTDVRRIRSRLELLCVLDDDLVFDDGTTGLDRLLALPQNEDQTWGGGGRPKNMAYALDDICQIAWEAN